MTASLSEVDATIQNEDQRDPERQALLNTNTRNQQYQACSNSDKSEENGQHNDSAKSENKSKCGKKEVIALYICTQWPYNKVRKMILGENTRCFDTKFCCSCMWIVSIIHVSVIILGAICQLLTCFSRQNPYAHWMLDNGTTADDNATGIQYCRLDCNINKNFVTSFFFPDFIIVLLSLWVYVLDEEKCKILKKCLDVDADLNMFEELSKSSTMQKKSRYNILSIGYIILSQLLAIVYLFVFFKITKKDRVIHSIIPNNGWLKYSAISISFIGFIAFDLLYIQVITRYAYYCDYVINHLESIIPMQDQIELQEQIEKPFKFLRWLNKSKTTITTEIVIVIAGFTAISCIINLFNTTDCPAYSSNHPFQVLAISFRLFLWILVALFPLYKAAKVNESSYQLSFQLTKHSRDFAEYSKSISAEARLIGISVHPQIPKVTVLLIIFAIMLGSGIKWNFSLL